MNLVDTETIVQAFKPLIDPIIQTQNELLVRTAPKKTKLSENASSIHSQARNEHFKCYQLDRDVFTNNYLKSYNDNLKSNLIRTQLLRYLVAVRRNLVNNQKDEKKFVEPSMNLLLNRITTFLKFRSVIIDERDYHLVLENRNCVTEIKGSADRTIKLESCDCHILTVEDKAIVKHSQTRIKHKSSLI